MQLGCDVPRLDVARLSSLLPPARAQAILRLCTGDQTALRTNLPSCHTALTSPFSRPFVIQEKKQSGIGKLREPLGDISLALPRSRSNVWPRSWKRFLIDFMYGRGYVMLYPNLNDQRAFSTTYMEHGDHTAKDGKRRSPYSRKPYPYP